MKSVRISSKGSTMAGQSLDKEFEKKEIQKRLMQKGDCEDLGQQLGKLIKQIEGWMEKKGCRGIRAGQKDIQNEQYPINSFRSKIFWLLEHFVENKQKSGVSEKVIEIKRKEKIKLRLIKSSDRLIEPQGVGYQNTENGKDKIIMDLRTANRNLQKRILVLGCEFKQLKDIYEAEITKYRRLLSSSLSQIQSQIECPGHRYPDNGFRKKISLNSPYSQAEIDISHKKRLNSEKNQYLSQNLNRRSFKTLMGHEKTDSKNTFGNIFID